MLLSGRILACVHKALGSIPSTAGKPLLDSAFNSFYKYKLAFCKVNIAYPNMTWSSSLGAFF
jgi:hypothetical protein